MLEHNAKWQRATQIKSIIPDTSLQLARRGRARLIWKTHPLYFLNVSFFFLFLLFYFLKEMVLLCYQKKLIPFLLLKNVIGAHNPACKKTHVIHDQSRLPAAAGSPL